MLEGGRTDAPARREFVSCPRNARNAPEPCGLRPLDQTTVSCNFWLTKRGEETSTVITPGVPVVSSQNPVVPP